MTYSEMLHLVDHTLLKACASWEEICRLCDEAVEYQTASVCVPPCYIKRIQIPHICLLYLPVLLMTYRRVDSLPDTRPVRAAYCV